MTSGNSTPSGLASGSTSAILAKRLSDVITWGTIVEADYEAGKFRVRIGEPDPLPDSKGGKADVLSYWLPVTTHRAGKNRSWIMPEVDDQVIVLSPNGHIACGFIAHHFNKEGHAPHASLDPNIQRQVFGDAKDLLDTMLEEFFRTTPHKLTNFPDTGMHMSVVGKDFPTASAITQTKDCISFRVEETSIAIYKDRIELQVMGKKVQLELTDRAIMAQVLDKSFLTIDADMINMQVQELSQLKIDATNILQRVEKAVSILEAHKWKAELTEDKVKIGIVPDGIGFQTDKAAQTITTTGDIVLTSNGSLVKLEQDKILVRTNDYDAVQFTVPPPDYQEAEAPPPDPVPVIPVYVPIPRPDLIPGKDPFIPPTPPAILE